MPRVRGEAVSTVTGSGLLPELGKRCQRALVGLAVFGHSQAVVDAAWANRLSVNHRNHLLYSQHFF
eukprot:1869494-Amphidinium_carterae.1